MQGRIILWIVLMLITVVVNAQAEEKAVFQKADTVKISVNENGGMCQSVDTAIRLENGILSTKWEGEELQIVYDGEKTGYEAFCSVLKKVGYIIDNNNQEEVEKVRNFGVTCGLEIASTNEKD